MGNLMLTAFADICGNPITAIDTMCKIFGVRGKVLPVSLDDAELCATLSDGSMVRGEGVIDTRSPNDDRHIVSVSLEPEANMYIGAYEAIVKANKIVFCPGDLYTSIIPNILVTGFRDAIANSKAKLVYVTNLMTKKAETHGFSASKFVSTLLDHLKRDQFDVVICNTQPISYEMQSRYTEEQAVPVRFDKIELGKLAKQVVTGNLADQTGTILRHSAKVASFIAQI